VLDLPSLQLPTGAFDIRIVSTSPPTTRDVVVAAENVDKHGAYLRLPLWADETLRGARRTFSEVSGRSPDLKVVQHLSLSVSNASDEPRDVWIEERLRPARKRDIRGVHPKLTIVDNVARMRVVVPPRGKQELTLTITHQL
jgi:hypothetical protein